MTRPADSLGPFVLYRWYDEAGTLVYLGITNDVARRTNEHRGKPWANECSMMTVTKLDPTWTWARVREYERERIWAERPLRNITHNQSVARVRPPAARRRRRSRRPGVLWLLSRMALRMALVTGVAVLALSLLARF